MTTAGVKKKLQKIKHRTTSLKALEVLDRQLKRRLGELQSLKAKGNRIVGYFPSGYVPEELIMASGAIPIALHWGGSMSQWRLLGHTRLCFDTSVQNVVAH